VDAAEETPMAWPIEPPLDPMLARLTRTLPTGDLLYEPKWDGFRCLVFRDGDELLLQSRSGKPLDRYFPELVDPDGNDPLRHLLPDGAIVDGELVVPIDGALDFDALSARIHPAASRVATLAAAAPARFVAFDLLAIDGRNLTLEPFRERRRMLVEVLGASGAPVHVTPATTDAARAADWFARFEGAGLDGVIAKPLGDAYQPGKRALVKVKRQRTADVVVAGFRRHKDDEGVGSLLLGLWRDGTLVHVGVASSFGAEQRRELLHELSTGPEDDLGAHPWGEPGRTPRGVGRWNAGRDTSFEPVASRVAEVAYEQLIGDRFRHNARFVRWRPDRDPASCSFDQLEVAPAAELADLLDAGRPGD
jgi:ATP-dependent DNA ligase